MDRPVSDPHVAGMETPGRFTRYRFFAYTPWKTIELWVVGDSFRQRLKKWFVFPLVKEMTEEQFFDQKHHRHEIRQREINKA